MEPILPEWSSWNLIRIEIVLITFQFFIAHISNKMGVKAFKQFGSRSLGWEGPLWTLVRLKGPLCSSLTSARPGEGTSSGGAQLGRCGVASLWLGLAFLRVDCQMNLHEFAMPCLRERSLAEMLNLSMHISSWHSIVWFSCHTTGCLCDSKQSKWSHGWSGYTCPITLLKALAYNPMLLWRGRCMRWSGRLWDSHAKRWAQELDAIYTDTMNLKTVPEL